MLIGKQNLNQMNGGTIKINFDAISWRWVCKYAGELKIRTKTIKYQKKISSRL